MKKLYEEGFSHVLLAALVVVVAAVGFTGWKVMGVKNTQKHNESSAGSATSKSETKKLEKPKNTTVENTQEKQPEVKKFNLVSTDGWVKVSSKDETISVNYKSQATHGVCSNNAGILLLGMSYTDLNKKEGYDCGSTKNAVSWSQTSTGLLLLTHIAFGPYEELWNRGDAKAVEVTLGNGDKAKRYEYTHTNDTFYKVNQYHTIEYLIEHGGKKYTAVQNWEDSSDINNGSNITNDEFDTIVQKTWAVK